MPFHFSTHPFMQVIHVNSRKTSNCSLRVTPISNEPSSPPRFQKADSNLCSDLLLRENLSLRPLIYTSRIGSPYETVGFRDQSDVQTFDNTTPNYHRSFSLTTGFGEETPNYSLARSAREYAASDILLPTNRNSGSKYRSTALLRVVDSSLFFQISFL
ncbi:hypothetical protein AVEN_65728-1 [Araneus ventricosus]|uniref:Uncharacterized protein n=1 Tax=Araneus ventricosus TaxID=182803 RepID=A0A4Y2AH11_ARAVE|nr:hypothetical protein AVEN_65728-1 [Araneus ventricosus]